MENAHADAAQRPELLHEADGQQRRADTLEQERADQRISRTMPPLESRPKPAPMTMRSRSVIVRRSSSDVAVMTDIKPRPPIWMSRRMTHLPKSDQCTAVPTVTRPVTQVALVAVNSAVSGGENAAAEGTPAVTLEQFGPARQTAGAYSVKAYDSSVIRQPASGQVDLSYFSDAAFLGDSLTVGFSDYKINLGGALICGYTGVGPDAIVNRSAVKSSVRGEEVALDVLAAAQPKKLYILLGTNTLTTVGAADRFLAYYGQMLDVLRQTLGEDCVIYVESIPPVRPEAAAEKPGLASDIIRSVNEQLALLAADKGCVYLDLWETLADGEGNLKEVLAAPDGVHFSAGNGYGAWVTYLRNHAKYSADNAWTPGSAYAG